MSLTESDLKAIEDIVTKRVEKCSCGIKPHHADQMGHFWGMVEDIGDGEVREGVETFRKVADAYKSVTKKSSMATKILIGLILTAAFYGALDVFKDIWFVVKARILGS